MAEAQLNPYIEYINVGSGEDTGDGDPVREAFIKCNNNFGFFGSFVDEDGNQSASIKSEAGKLLVDAINGWLPYYPDKPNNWPDGVPLDINTAINRIAERLRQMLLTRMQQIQIIDITTEHQKVFNFSDDFIGYEPVSLWHNVEIFHNGARLIMGKSYDFEVTGTNQITLFDAWSIDIGDKLMAISQDFPVIQTHRASEVAAMLA